MRWIEASLAATFERRVGCDELAILEDADGVGQDVHVEYAPARRVGHAVEIAADAYHALVGDAPFKPQNRLIGRQRQRLQGCFLFGEGFVDDPMHCRVNAGIGDCVEPMPQLDIEVVEIAERAAKKEVLADITERSLDFSLRLWPIRSASARLEAIVPGNIEKRTIIDHEPIGAFAHDGGLHAIVEDFAWSAADRLQGGDVTAQDALQILMDDKRAQISRE